MRAFRTAFARARDLEPAFGRYAVRARDITVELAVFALARVAVAVLVDDRTADFFAAALARQAACASARAVAACGADLADDLDLAADLDLDLSLADEDEREEAIRIASSAAGLLAAAVRLLPAGPRTRYSEEYQAELNELVRAGARRPQQVLYALRQLRSAPQLGAALRSPRRGGAVP